MAHDEKFVGIINSYKNWEKQGIQVLKGSKAYKIRVPILKKVMKTSFVGTEITQEEEKMTAIFLMKSFDESIDYNFAYSNIWSGKIKENFDVDEFITLTTKIIEFISKRIKIRTFISRPSGDLSTNEELNLIFKKRRFTMLLGYPYVNMDCIKYFDTNGNILEVVLKD